MRGLDGSDLSRRGLQVQDRVHLIYTDTPFAFEENFESLSRYAEALRDAAFEALQAAADWGTAARCGSAAQSEIGGSATPPLNHEPLARPVPLEC
jgi:hypothetical protein